MTTFAEVSDALRTIMVRAILKYSGGKFSGKRPSGKRLNTPANSTILAQHFTKGNSAIYLPLSQAYKTWKTKKVGNQPILVFSGDMRDSIVGQGLIFAVGRGKYVLTFPKAKAYALFHARGDGVPVRHPTELTRAERQQFDAAVLNSIDVVIAALSKDTFKPKIV